MATTEGTESYDQLLEELEWLSSDDADADDNSTTLSRIVGTVLNVNKMLRSIVEHSPDGIVLSDGDGAIIMWSPGQEEITGLTPLDVLGRSLWDVQYQMMSPAQDSVLDSASMQLMGRMVDALNTGSGDWLNQILEQDIWRPDGHRRSVQVRFYPIATQQGFSLGATYRDVTDRMPAGDDLQKLSHVVDVSPMGVFITDVTGSIEYVNPRFINMSGYGADEMVGKNISAFSNLPSPDDDALLWETLSSSSEMRGEFLNVDKNGEYYWAATTVMPVRNSEGQVAYYVGINEDITQRKRQEQAQADLERLREDLRETVVHDLRAPATLIRMSLEMLEQDVADEEKRALVHVLSKGSEEILRLADAFLDVGKLQSGDYMLDVRKIEIVSIIQQSVEHWRAAAALKEVALQVAAVSDKLHIEADEHLISRVIGNLVSNAIKFAPSGTSVLIAASATDEHVTISVTDSGPGIAPEDQERIFTKYTQLERQMGEKGAGVGLAFCKLAVEAHGGTIAVDSAPGEGSTFSFSLPYVAIGA